MEQPQDKDKKYYRNLLKEPMLNKTGNVEFQFISNNDYNKDFYPKIFDKDHGKISIKNLLTNKKYEASYDLTFHNEGCNIKIAFKDFKLVGSNSFMYAQQGLLINDIESAIQYLKEEFPDFN